jgi:NADP-dependent 3-hydroxy acid dehydrogenase YdfG
MHAKTIWITGCTSGLGRALVDEFTKAGHTVAGCGRRAELIEELQQLFPAPHFFATVDVASNEAAA